MNKSSSFNQRLNRLSEVLLSINQGASDLNTAQLKLRLQTATAPRIDAEAGIAWRNRMIVRARLRRYASSNPTINNCASQ